MPQTNEFGQAVGDLVENWSPKKRPAATILQGGHCMLESISIEKHAAKLFEAFALENQGESWTYLPYGPFETLELFEKWIAITKAEKETELYVILHAKTRAPIGLCGYLRITPEHGSIEIGHVHFSKLLKQTAAATEAIYLLLTYAFDKLNYRRCEWKCHSLNEASKAAAKRLGFQYEGTFRQSFVFKNRNRDTAWFSIIDSEWPILKTKFARWLSSDNFNATGEQILKLSEV